MVFRKGFSFFLLASFLCLGGCAVGDPTAVKLTQGDRYSFYSSTAATRNLMIREPNDPRIFCAEPPPDVALDEDAGFEFSPAFLNIAPQSGDEADEGVAEAGLGGRSTNVLVTREIFFRTCEFMGNVTLDDAGRLALFQKALDAVAEVNKQNLGTGTENKAGVDTIMSAGQPAPPAATAAQN